MNVEARVVNGPIKIRPNGVIIVERYKELVDTETGTVEMSRMISRDTIEPGQIERAMAFGVTGYADVAWTPEVLAAWAAIIAE